MKYDVYHDECKEDAYWHCFLFVPKNSRAELLNILSSIRVCIKWNLHFSKLDTKNIWTKHQWCKSLLSALSSSFQQVDKWKMEDFLKYSKSQYCHEAWRNFSEYSRFSESPKVKIAIFHLKNNHQDMSFGDELSKIETTFRMWLQWAKHYLFNENENIILDKIYLDWFEHYNITTWRNFDINRVKSKLINNSREYVNFTNDFHILDGKLEENNKLFLDIIDLFLGVFRQHYLVQLGKKEKDARYVLFDGIRWVIEKNGAWRARMRNSRFDNFWTFSTWYIENWNWNFSDIIQEIQKNKLSEEKNIIQSLF